MARYALRAILGVLLVSSLIPAFASAAETTAATSAAAALPANPPTRTLDGSGNNVNNPTWGQAGTPYSRIAPPNYADGKSAMVTGPNARYVSNRIYNDIQQALFSERNVTAFGNVWGQFMDHTFGMAQEGGAEDNIPFAASDPLESFRNDFGTIFNSRNAAAPGTGVTNPRQAINTVSSYIDAFNVYGGTNQRLEWLREGPVDGNMSNNSCKLLLPEKYLPTETTRNADGSGAPEMAHMGKLAGTKNASVAGDVRANENIALNSLHTLFAREHNRICDALKFVVFNEEQKFQIARRIVGAEEQYITYTAFLPAFGIQLPAYAGYNPNINANLTTEFATVGYRAHSMIHGDLEQEAKTANYTQAQLEAIKAEGVKVEVNGENVHFSVPLTVAFGNPALVKKIGLGAILQGLGAEPQYKNDEQISNQLRSVLFQVPVSGNPECLLGRTLPECFNGVSDLGAIDLERGRDHGVPLYNNLRAALGLPKYFSFTQITGESTDALPAGLTINSPSILEFTALKNIKGEPIAFGTEAAENEATFGERRATVAAKLKAIYGNVNNIDAFTGMISERHVTGTEFGPSQLASWTREFSRLRDGDRFFYANDQELNEIQDTLAPFLNISYKRTLKELIALNTNISSANLRAELFKLP
jgi:hypothetical protein